MRRLPVVHRGRDFGHVPGQLRVGEPRQDGRPRVADPGRQVAGLPADPRFQHRRVGPGPGERPAGDCLAEDFVTVQPGEFGGTDGAPQHVGVVQNLLGVGRARALANRAGVAGVRLGPALVHPDRMERAEMVSVGQCLLAGFGRGQLGVVAADGWGQDRDGILTVQGGRWPGAVAVGSEPALPGDLRIGPGRLAYDALGRFLRSGVGVDLVPLGAPGHRHVQALAGPLVARQCDADGHGLPLDGVPGQRVPEVTVLGRVGAADRERG